MTYYADAHDDGGVTTEGLADVILTMRWVDLERVASGVTLCTHAARVTPSALHTWAVDYKHQRNKMRHAKEAAAGKKTVK